METILKFSSCILFFLFLQQGFSQKDKEKILANFDYVEYYPDSTFRAAHKFTGVTLERYTVEFNEVGMPVAIGNYQKGIKVGNWCYSDGSFDEYDEKFSNLYTPQSFQNYQIKSTGSLYPGCGTGVTQAIKLFKQRYEEAINCKECHY
jgi:hypothetical protein